MGKVLKRFSGWRRAGSQEVQWVGQVLKRFSSWRRTGSQAVQLMGSGKTGTQS